MRSGHTPCKTGKHPQERFFDAPSMKHTPPLSPLLPAPPHHREEEHALSMQARGLYPDTPSVHTRRLSSYFILLLMVLTFAGCLGLFVGEEEFPQEEKTASLSQGVDLRGRALVLSGYNGSVLIEGTPYDRATLSFEKVAYAASGAEAKALVETITINHTSAADVYKVEMFAHEAGRTGVNVTATVPFGTDVKVMMENGAVVLLKVQGKVHVETKNGSVQVEGARDDVTVAASNSNVTVKLATCPDDVNLDLRTKTGNITLYIPEDASTWLMAESKIGSVRRSDVLQFKRAEVASLGDAGERFTGALGTGSGNMALRINAGSIFIREAE